MAFWIPYILFLFDMLLLNATCSTNDIMLANRIVPTVDQTNLHTLNETVDVYGSVNKLFVGRTRLRTPNKMVDLSTSSLMEKEMLFLMTRFAFVSMV